MYMAGLSDVDVRQLAALRAVADQGSFGRAAAALGYSQAAVSQQIAGLEKAIGMKVFDRPAGPRPPVLTSAGRLLLAHAVEVLARLEQADRQLADLAAGVGGRLDVGTFQSASVALLPKVVADLRREAPDLDIRLHETDDNDEEIRGLLCDELDVAFAIGPIVDNRLDVTALVDDPFVAVTPADDCPVSQGQRVSVPTRSLDDYPVVAGSVDDSCQVIIDGELRARGVSPRYVFRSADNAAIQAMVAARMGAAVMPLLAVDLDDPTVHVHRLHPPLPPRQICVAVRADRTVVPAARRLVELALQHAPDVSAARLTEHSN